MTKFSSKRLLSPQEEDEIQRMIAADPDAPEATDEQLAQAKPFREVFPDLAASIDREIAKRGRGRPPLEAPKVAVTLRVEPEVLEWFKSQGANWRGAMSETLRKATDKH